MSDSISTSLRRSSRAFPETYDGADEFEGALRDGLKPDPLLSVSEWADKHRVLSQRAASEPGRWRTSRTPYLKEIMDCLSPASKIERVVFMKGSQIGGTECGNNWIGYVIHQAPGPMMAVAPTVELAKRNSKQRIEPQIEDSPVLRDRVKPSRSRDSGNTILSKEFPGGVLVLTGANSAVGLRSMPARYLFLDEVDGYPGGVEGEGDPILLAERANQAQDLLTSGTGGTRLHAIALANDGEVPALVEFGTFVVVGDDVTVDIAPGTTADEDPFTVTRSTGAWPALDDGLVLTLSKGVAANRGDYRLSSRTDTVLTLENTPGNAIAGATGTDVTVYRWRPIWSTKVPARAGLDGYPAAAGLEPVQMPWLDAAGDRWLLLTQALAARLPENVNATVTGNVHVTLFGGDY